MNGDEVPRWDGEGVLANCPGCEGAISRFLTTHSANGNGTNSYSDDRTPDGQLVHHLLRCAGCNRSGYAVVVKQDSRPNKLIDFYPFTIDREVLPSGLPLDLESEFRESEDAASVRAFRAATTLLRSVLEKTLKANGYDEGNLKQSIDAAATDGVITASRKRQMHQDVRRLGNDIVHDDWRPVDVDEFRLARRYVVWVLEDFYADRPTVEAELIEAGRLHAPPESVTSSDEALP